MKTVPPPPIMAAITAILQPYGINAAALIHGDESQAGRNEPKWLSPRMIEDKYATFQKR